MPASGVLGLDGVTAEDAAGWLSFLRMVARRYVSVESLAKARINVIERQAVEDSEEVRKEPEAAS